MSLKIYNVLSGKKEKFIPIEEGKVKMYACGITASGNAHLGHGYQALIFDVIRNYLEFKGYEVTYVRNYTDVDDKIIIKARELGIEPMKYSRDIMINIDRDLKRLEINGPTIMAKATESIDDIINFIKKLIDNGNAYSTKSGDVYFRVKSFLEYGKLSNRIIDNSINGVRKDIEPDKEDERDFALWKNAKNDEIFWESPWGLGRPGWHIECSAMNLKYLGEQIDIHGGGKDLIFPHHENEIAQTESLTGKKFANYWIHNGLIKINGEKMSKSLNNSIFLSDLLDKYNPEVIRLTLLENSYRSDLNILDDDFDRNEKMLYKVYSVFNSLDILNVEKSIDINSDEYTSVKNNFIDAMDNDFNTSLAISNIYEEINNINRYIKEEKYESAFNIKASLIDNYKIIKLLQQNSYSFIENTKEKYLHENNITREEIINYISKRNEYKFNKEYEKADEIRNILLEKNIILKDNKENTVWDIKV